MARAFVAASTQYLEIGSAILSAAPISFCCWFKPNSVGTAGTIFSITTSGSANNYFRTDISASGANRTRTRDGASVSDAITTTLMTAGTWYFVGSRWNSATDRAAFLNTDKATNTTSRTPTGVNRTAIGRSSESAGTSYLDGTVAFPALWNIGLSDADFAQLARGTHPLRVRPDGLLSYWPLKGLATPETDIVGKNELTVTGATKADNPRINLPE